MQLTKSLIVVFQSALCLSYCMREPIRTFHRVKSCQRSTQDIAALENVASLQECLQLASHSRGMAVNYSPLRANTLNLFEVNQDSVPGVDFPRRSNRRHYLEQPEEFFNCHVLQCPESSAYSTITNDSRFDYYSLYGRPPTAKDFVCVPEVGIFQVSLMPENYATASGLCNNKIPGSLAHVASEKRTAALSRILQRARKSDGGVGVAFVGLNLTTRVSRLFQTSQNEDLNCFLYRAWGPGHPKKDRTFVSSSCVALTTDATWITVNCERSLPYICEIFTSGLEVLVKRCPEILTKFDHSTLKIQF